MRQRNRENLGKDLRFLGLLLMFGFPLYGCCCAAQAQTGRLIAGGVTGLFIWLAGLWLQGKQRRRLTDRE